MAGSVEESEKWLLRAEKTLGAARILADNGFYNEAVSRAYYSMFYAAKAAVDGEWVRVKKHSAVISAFGRLFTKTGRLDAWLHRALMDAFEQREDADYLVELAVSEEDARVEATAAEKFLTAVRSILAT